MKATRRHELRENDLEHAFQVARTYAREHGARIGLFVVAFAAAVVLVSLTFRSRAAAVEDAWRARAELSFADPETARQSLERLIQITNEASDETFVLAGLLEQGKQALRAAQLADTPPDREMNEIARGAFEGLLQRFPDNPLAIGAGLCGLATVEENMFVLDADESHKGRAREHLRAVLGHSALGALPFSRIARDRLEALDAVFTPVAFAAPEAAPEAAPSSTYEYGAPQPTPFKPGAIELVTSPPAEPETTKPEEPENTEPEDPATIPPENADSKATEDKPETAGPDDE